MGCNHDSEADTRAAIKSVLADCGAAAAKRLGLAHWPAVPLGCGAQGCVYNVGHRIVAKVTCSMNELRFYLFAQKVALKKDVFMLPVVYDAFQLGDRCGGPLVDIDEALSGQRVWPYGVGVREDLRDVESQWFSSSDDWHAVEAIVDLVQWVFQHNDKRSHAEIKRRFEDARAKGIAGGPPAAMDALELYIHYLRGVHGLSELFRENGLEARDVKLANFGLRIGKEREGMVMRDLGFISPPTQGWINSVLDKKLPKLPQLAGLGRHRLAIDDDWPDDMPSIPLRGILQPLSHRHLWEL